jgi:tetratricopeptide (TPR) repeat protein
MKRPGKDGKRRSRGLGLIILSIMAIGGLLHAANPTSDSLTNAPGMKMTEPPKEPVPVTARDFFNAGTRRLREGKLKEAEAFFQAALSKQAETIRPNTLYNLGHIRFAQGIEELKKSLAAGPIGSAADSANNHATEAIGIADDALAGNDMDKLIAAYMNGRGRRKEMKAVTEAVKQALEAHGSALRRWERSSGDFKGAVELNQKDSDAAYNARVVDESIARLIDSLQQMRQAAAMMGAQSKTLGEKMKELKGRIPASKMPPGAPGDDDDEEEMPMGKDPQQKEGASKNGEEMKLSPEQAGWMLEGFKLGDKRLPMAPQGQQGKPRDKTRSPW